MNQAKRRLMYQYGTLVLEKRSRGPSVWIYRYFEFENGKKRRRNRLAAYASRSRKALHTSE